MGEREKEEKKRKTKIKKGKKEGKKRIFISDLTACFRGIIIAC